MAAEHRAAPAALVAAPLLVTLLVGCSTSGQPTPTTSRPTPGAGSSAASAVEPTASASPTRVAPSAAATSSPSAFDRTAVPAMSDGPLTGRALPDPDALGPGWVARVDPGSAEDGYTGNGTPVVARQPRDVAEALLPIGCADTAVYAVPVPVPRHALEVDYAYRPSGAHGVALALDYGDEASARSFVRIYTTALGRCTAGDGGSTVVAQAAAPSGAFASVQVDGTLGTTWRELVVRTGSVVRLVAVEGARTPSRSWAAVVAALPAV